MLNSECWMLKVEDTAMAEPPWDLRERLVEFARDGLLAADHRKDAHDQSTEPATAAK
jgi:hypothetical protein